MRGREKWLPGGKEEFFSDFFKVCHVQQKYSKMHHHPDHPKISLGKKERQKGWEGGGRKRKTGRKKR